MAAFRHFPYFGATMRMVRAAFDLNQDEVGAMMGVGHQQVGKYEKDQARPSLEALGDFLTALGLTLGDFWKLMETAGEMRRRSAGEGYQYELWTEVPSDVLEPQAVEVDVVRSIVYFTHRGKLVAVEDSAINQILTTFLASHKPQKVLFTLELPPRELTRETAPPRRRQGGKKTVNKKTGPEPAR